VLTKIDLLRAKTDLLPLLETYHERRPEATVVPISAVDGDGLNELLGELFDGLPEGPAFYPADLTTTQTERFFVAEVVREKLLERTRDELPYTVGVIVDLFDESGSVLHLEAAIYVERKSQKGIVIGKGGRMIREVGKAAREELERVLGTDIYLGLRVKVHPRWRDDPRVLREMEPGAADLSEIGNELPGTER
jgi:GTP-binding protein Era